VTQPSGLLLGQHDHLDGLLGKPLEHGPGARETKLSGLKRRGGCGWHLSSRTCDGDTRRTNSR
jgi:hypothetical protein